MDGGRPDRPRAGRLHRARDRQVDRPYYYGGGGEAFVVGDLESAIEALDEIVYEGEGFDHSIYDGSLGEGEELAHYFRFDELSRGRRYVRGDTPSTGPSGPADPARLRRRAADAAEPEGVDDHPPGASCARWPTSATAPTASCCAG